MAEGYAVGGREREGGRGRGKEKDKKTKNKDMVESLSYMWSSHLYIYVRMS